MRPAAPPSFNPATFPGLSLDSGFTQFPNVWLDVVAPFLPMCAQVVFAWIWRNTGGWHRPAAVFTMDQIRFGFSSRDGKPLNYGVQLSKNTVIKAIEVLLEKRLIEREQGENNVWVYRARLCCRSAMDEYFSGARGSESEPLGSSKPERQGVQKMNPYKRKSERQVSPIGETAAQPPADAAAFDLSGDPEVEPRPGKKAKPSSGDSIAPRPRRSLLPPAPYDEIQLEYLRDQITELAKSNPRHPESRCPRQMALEILGGAKGHPVESIVLVLRRLNEDRKFRTADSYGLFRWWALKQFSAIEEYVKTEVAQTRTDLPAPMSPAELAKANAALTGTLSALEAAMTVVSEAKCPRGHVIQTFADGVVSKCACSSPPPAPASDFLRSSRR